MPDRALICRYLQKSNKNAEVLVYDSVGSTNSEAKKLAGTCRRAVFAADMQTAGRGRQGKSFYSPARTGLYMSVLLDVNPLAAHDFALTAAAAVFVCRAVSELCGIEPQIKWVNDLYLGGKKICGILTEAAGDRVIVGIGINVSTAYFPKDLPLAGSLNTRLCRDELCACIAAKLFDFADAPGLSFMDEYRRRSMLLGREITYERGGELRTALACAIEDDGSLTVKANGITETLRSGEVNIRL